MGGVLDLFFPSRCLTCGDFMEVDCPWCAECHRFIGYMASRDVCVVCCRELSQSGACASCLRRRPVYDSLTAGLVYEDDVAALLSRVKYSRDLAAAKSVAEWMAASLSMDFDHVAVPPVHRKDLRKRGFHLPTLIARWLGVKAQHPLTKVRRTEPQASLTAEGRLTNLLDAFQSSEVTGRWLVIDDVATTGATLSEAARALKASGASEVHAWVLARSL